ncbi:MAG: hypothetical protein NW200_02860 [Hyphomonadaceae bacterium]|nr:hypothetical protein [Hyphomonadaceae bacterium]
MATALLSLAGLAFGAAIGLYGLLDPRWAARLVRLREDGPGGFSEFRATFGGLFLASQAAGLVFVGAHLLGVTALGGAPVIGLALGAVTVCGLMWIGTGLARVASMALDGTDTPYHRVAVGVEFFMGAVILSLWLSV